MVWRASNLGRPEWGFLFDLCLSQPGTEAAPGFTRSPLCGFIPNRVAVKFKPFKSHAF